MLRVRHLNHAVLRTGRGGGGCSSCRSQVQRLDQSRPALVCGFTGLISLSAARSLRVDRLCCGGDCEEVSATSVFLRRPACQPAVSRSVRLAHIPEIPCLCDVAFSAGKRKVMVMVVDCFIRQSPGIFTWHLVYVLATRQQE